jgi:hypothetical protein
MPLHRWSMFAACAAALAALPSSAAAQTSSPATALEQLGAPFAALRPAAQQRLRASAGEAGRLVAGKRDCAALTTVAPLDLLFHDRASYRSPKLAARGAAVLGRRLDAAERAILATGRARACAVASDPLPVAPSQEGSSTPVAPTVRGEHEPEGRPQKVPLRKGDSRFKTAGAPVAVERPLKGAFAAQFPTLVQSTDAGSVTFCGFPHEVQVAEGADVVLISGNCGAFVSIDHGRTFASMSPYTVFGTSAGGYGGDSQLRYSPDVDRFVWVMQAADLSRYVISIASPAQLATAVAAGTPVEQVWTGNRQYRITTASFRRGGKAVLPADTTFDRPDMAVGPTFAYLTWDRFPPGAPGGTLNLRLPLADMAAGRRVNGRFFQKTPELFARVAQVQRGGKARQGFGLFVVGVDKDATHVRGFFWSDSSNVVTSVKLQHTAIPDRGFKSRSPAGGNWMPRIEVAATAVQSAALRSAQLWVAWEAGRGYSDSNRNVFPQPHVQVAVYSLARLLDGREDRSSLPAVKEDNYFNGGLAFAFPYLATAESGDVGVGFSLGGRDVSPAPGAGAASRRAFFHAIAIADNVLPTSPCAVDLQQGDYAAIQPASTDAPGQPAFVTSGYIARNPACGQNDYVYEEFVLP